MENNPNSYYHYNPNHNKKPPSSSKTSKNSNHNHELNNNNNGGKRGPPKLSTDPQSVAARERRHRISDRFKILQTLVPGGAKLDTVSLLEQAIQYVKFLKAQIWLHQAIINPKHVNMDNDHASSIYNNNNNNNNSDYDCCYCVNDAKVTLNDDDDQKVMYYDQSYPCYDLMMHGNDGANHQGEINNNNNMIGASQVATAMETQTATPDFCVGYQMDEGNYDEECLYYRRSLNYY